MASGYGLAEIYVLRKLHKEKMNTMDQEEGKDNNMDAIEFKEKTSSGCFFWVFKKVHPSSTRIVGCPGKEVETWGGGHEG
ncbi:hypothetical protein I3843_05G207800 [Carya illinoinensis]|nr:hypothetical protein I3843_05G207800 [Carya illinoinensis]